jgi:hypothetical protein
MRAKAEAMADNGDEANSERYNKVADLLQVAINAIHEAMAAHD